VGPFSSVGYTAAVGYLSMPGLFKKEKEEKYQKSLIF
jgi:hypothetical protein